MHALKQGPLIFIVILLTAVVVGGCCGEAIDVIYFGFEDFGVVLLIEY